MGTDPELSRILAGVEGTLARQERALQRQERAFERQERAFTFEVQTFENLIAVTERMIERLDDMGDHIRANTQAVPARPRPPRRASRERGRLTHGAARLHIFVACARAIGSRLKQ